MFARGFTSDLPVMVTIDKKNNPGMDVHREAILLLVGETLGQILSGWKWVRPFRYNRVAPVYTT